MPNEGESASRSTRQWVASTVEGDPGFPVAASGLREQLVAAQEAKFGFWWGAFLLNALETLKSFHRFGDDEGQLLAWALAMASLPSTETAPQGAPSLSEIRVMTGIPLETARRHLLKMTEAGLCRRDGTRYAASLLPEVRTVSMERLVAFAALL